MKKTIFFVLVLALGVVADLAKADFTFGTPTSLGPTVNSSAWDVAPSISADGLELFFWSTRPGGSGQGDIWVTTRPTKNDPWGNPVNLGLTVNSSTWDVHPCVSADRLSLYFGSMRPGTSGHYDLWVTTRETTNGDWGPPVNLGPTINSPVGEWGLSISADGLTLCFGSQRSGGSGGLDLWVTTRETTNDDWGPPVNLGPTVNSSSEEYCPSISIDGRTLFFGEWPGGASRPGGYGSTDIWMTTRATKSDLWGEPVNLGPTINTSSGESDPKLSADGSTLYFDADRPGGSGSWDLWQAPIIPIVDFNGDGKVDFKDFSKLAQHWGQNQRSVDMGPRPLGDGVVDIQDAAVLAEYWLVEFGLVAHWKLDETGGFVAHDSVGAHDGFVLTENPLWRPTDGKIHGALELDGIDDFISVPFVLDPAEKPFSTFAWIRDGGPGQAIISQTGGPAGGSTWLGIDASAGKLMSGLMYPQPALQSESVITDGQWHEIGLVWDGSRRHLYVDDTEVASDLRGVVGVASDGGLYFGAGKDRESGTFFSGLIDNVKIYDRAIVP